MTRTTITRLAGVMFLLYIAMGIAAFPFAVGSTIYSYLFLRARSIPVSLAWLGVFASLPLVVLLPAQLVGFVKAPATTFMWLPMLVFEVVLALLFLMKGVAIPSVQRSPGGAP